MLLFVMIILLLLNIVTAVSGSFDFILVARLLTGMFAALTLPLATTIAVSMVPDDKRPKAISTVLVGYTVAFLLGIPVGSILGDLFGWQAAFGFAAVITAISVLVIAVAAPNEISVPNTSNVSFKSALVSDNPRLMICTMLIFFSTFSTVAYIGPVVTSTTSIMGSGIGWVQIATGIGGLLGLPVGAYFGRLPIRQSLYILLSVTFATQILFSVGMLFNLYLLALPMLLIAMASGSAALFASLPVIQSKLAQNAGAATTIAFALNGTMLYLGQGLGASLGGLVIDSAGIAWLGAVGALVALLGLWNVSKLGIGKPSTVK
jgi:DHA1 family inner membrane transport protein